MGSHMNLRSYYFYNPSAFLHVLMRWDCKIVQCYDLDRDFDNHGNDYHQSPLFFLLWVSVNSTEKVFDGWIRNLGFNPAYTKTRLVFWFNDNELSLGEDIIGKNSFLKKKVHFYYILLIV